MRTALLVALFVCGALAAPAPGADLATVYAQDGQLVLQLGVADPHGVAMATYTDADLHPSNFGVLDVSTNSTFADSQQMFAAGMLEGALTANRTLQMHHNMQAWLDRALSNDTCPVNAFLQQQYECVATVTAATAAAALTAFGRARCCAAVGPSLSAQATTRRCGDMWVWIRSASRLPQLS